MKIYTKKGDDGSTSLVGGTRVSKDDSRVEAYGTIDELLAHTAMLGDLLAGQPYHAIGEELTAVKEALMHISALFALDRHSEVAMARVAPFDTTRTLWLEEWIDAHTASLPQIQHFTLPGGSPALSQCHICRTVCRRAERRAYTAYREHGLDAPAMAYLNRLSDYFYTLGRVICRISNIAEKKWANF